MKKNKGETMKVLFLGSQNIKENVTSGGMQFSKRNFDLIAELVDENNLFTAIVWNSKKEYARNHFFERCSNNVDSLISSIKLCRLYKASQEKKILKYIAQVNPDILFLDASILGKILKKINKNIKIIVYMQNVEIEYAKNRVINEGAKYFPAYIATVYNEKLAVKCADKLICLNDRDSRLVEKIYNRKTDFLLPIAFKDRFDPARICRKGSSNILLFIGSFFGPNYDGIKWFIKNVMLELKLKGYKLFIVGKDFEKVKTELENSNVEVIGTVEDLDEYYYRYFNIVMPIQYGAGMKVKTAEAMMFGMNIFATDEALMGYNADHVDGIFRCNTKEDFVREIIQHSSRIEECCMNEEVRKIFVNSHCFGNQIELMKKII